MKYNFRFILSIALYGVFLSFTLEANPNSKVLDQLDRLISSTFGKEKIADVDPVDESIFESDLSETDDLFFENDDESADSSAFESNSLNKPLEIEFVESNTPVIEEAVEESLPLDDGMGFDPFESELNQDTEFFGEQVKENIPEALPLNTDTNKNPVDTNAIELSEPVIEEAVEESLPLDDGMGFNPFESQLNQDTEFFGEQVNENIPEALPLNTNTNETLVDTNAIELSEPVIEEAVEESLPLDDGMGFNPFESELNQDTEFFGESVKENIPEALPLNTDTNENPVDTNAIELSEPVIEEVVEESLPLDDGMGFNPFESELNQDSGLFTEEIKDGPKANLLNKSQGLDGILLDEMPKDSWIDADDLLFDEQVKAQEESNMKLKDLEETPQDVFLDKNEIKDTEKSDFVGDIGIDDIGSKTVIDMSEVMEELDDLAREADMEDMYRDPVDTVEEMKELYSDWVSSFDLEGTPEYEGSLSEPAWLKNGRYRLKIGDRLLISIYGAGGTTQEVVIDFTGSFNYLLIGEVFALGKTVDEIRDELNTKVSEIFRFAFISVTPISFEGHYYTILGEVNTPGKKTLRARTTLLGAICQSGGFKSGTYRTQTIDIANLKHAFLARNGEYIPVDFEALIIDGDLSEDIVLQSQDYIYIPSSLHREISILGEVSFPTTIGFLNEVSLVEAISQARGVTADASSRVVVIRGALSNPETYLVDFNRIVKGYERDFNLAPGDIVYVPPFKLKNFRDIVRLGIRSFVSSFSGAGGADLFEAMVPDSSARRPELGGGL